MPDPHILYVVMAVVVLGLVAWVVVVLSRPAENESRAVAGAARAAGRESPPLGSTAVDAKQDSSGPRAPPGEQ